MSRFIPLQRRTGIGAVYIKNQITCIVRQYDVQFLKAKNIGFKDEK